MTNKWHKIDVTGQILSGMRPKFHYRVSNMFDAAYDELLEEALKGKTNIAVMLKAELGDLGNVSLGYFKEPEERVHAIKTGWLPLEAYPQLLAEEKNEGND